MIALRGVGDPPALAVGRTPVVARPRSGCSRTHPSSVRSARSSGATTGGARCTASPGSSWRPLPSRTARRLAVSEVPGTALVVRRRRRDRARVLRVPRAAGPLLPVAARLRGRHHHPSRRGRRRDRPSSARQAVTFVPGQFALVYIEAKDGWHRHPFTIASSPDEGVVRVTVKALGDYTSSLRDLLEPGMPAVIGGPHGRFNHAKGTRDQIWIAGGVGVAPFLSWMRALEVHPPPGEVDLYYAFTGGPAPFADELSAIGVAHDNVRVHLVDSAVAGPPDRRTHHVRRERRGIRPVRLPVRTRGDAARPSSRTARTRCPVDEHPP